MVRESVDNSMVKDNSVEASRVYEMPAQIEDLLAMEAKSQLDTTTAAVIDQ